jgi:hypothetical protein
VSGGRSAFPYHEGKHLIVALKQFVLADESGAHEDSIYCIVGGYRGSPGQWDIFNTGWRAVLQKYGVTEFHSNVFFNRKRITSPEKNPYLKWTDQKADEYLGELLKVINGRRIYPVGCAVDVRDFENCSYGERCVLVGYEPTPSHRKSQRPAPYHAAFRHMLADAIMMTQPDTALHFTFALQKEYKQRALEAYTLLKKLGKSGREDQLRGIAFETPTDWPGLQAADLLMHHWYYCWVQLWKGKRLSSKNVAIMNVLTHKRNDMPLLNAAAIDRAFAAVGISLENRQQLKRVKEPVR